MSIATTGLVVEMAHTSTPLAASPTWTAITNRVRRVEYTRGRVSPHEPMPAGAITVDVDNADRAFDRTFTTGPFYGTQLDVGMRLRVRDTVHAETLVTGWVDDWPMTWGRLGAGTVSLRADESLRLLGDTDVFLPRPVEETCAARLFWLLTAVGFPIGLMDVDAGLCLLQPATLDGSALEHAQLIAESDGGVLAAGRTGTVVFHDRHAPLRETRQSVPQWNLSPSGAHGTVPYATPTVGTRRGLLVNTAIIGRAGAPEEPAVVEDATSRTNYGARSRNRTELAHTSITDSQAIAEVFVQSWASPQEPATITLHPVATTDDAYEIIATMDLRDLWNLEWSPGNLAPRTWATMTVEGYTVTADSTGLRATVNLAPARLQQTIPASVWLRADSTDQANGTRRAAT